MIRPVAAVLIACCLLTTGPARGGVADRDSLTLAGALDRAMQNNPKVQATAVAARAQDRGARAEKDRGLGELRFDGGVIRNSEATLIRPITPEILSSGVPDMPFDDQFAFWSLSYRVPVLGWGTVSGARETARLSALSSHGGARRTMWEIRHRVLATFVGLLSLEARKNAMGLELTALDSLVGHIELGRLAGQYSRVDLLKARVDRQTTVVGLQKLSAASQGQYAELMALMGVSETSPEPYQLVPVRYAPADTVLPPLGDLIAKALLDRSDLQAARNAAAAKRAIARVTKGNRLPQISIGAKLSGVHAGTIDYDDSYWAVDALVSVPLFDMGRRKNQSRKATLTARSAELDADDLVGRIRSEVTSALAAVENARSSMTTQQTTLELASEVSRLERLRYDSGRGDIDNLLRSRAERLLAEASLIQARHDFLIALDNLHLTIEGDMP